MKTLIIIFVVVSTAGLLWGPIMSQVERPKYKVIMSKGSIEVRSYLPTIVAEVEVDGEREQAINQGFRLLADYIFGNNIKKDKIAMTAPVTQQSSQKIAMTAPVTQQVVNDKWRVQFIMPSEYTLESLPSPVQPEVLIKKIPAKVYAAIKFNGNGDNQNITKHQSQLNKFLTDMKLLSKSEPMYAFYNPPWTLPAFRRNEVMIEIYNIDSQVLYNENK